MRVAGHGCMPAWRHGVCKTYRPPCAWTHQVHLAAVRHRPLDGLRPDPEALCAGLVGAGDCEAALGPLLGSPGQLGEELVQERRLAHSGAAADGDDRDGAMQLFQNVDGLGSDRELLRGRVEADELGGHFGCIKARGSLTKATEASKKLPVIGN